MNRFTRALLSALLLTVCAFAALADDSRDTIGRRLRADLEAGTISDDEAVLYAAVAMTNTRLLPERYQARFDHEGMELVAILHERMSVAHPDVQDTVRYILSPPHKRKEIRKPDPSALIEDDAVAELALAASLGTHADETEHFYVVYTPAKTPPETLNIIEAGLEAAWAEFSATGFSMPVSSDGKIDVAIIDNPCAVPVTEFDCGVGGVALPPGIASYANGGDGDPLILLRAGKTDEKELKALAAHEVFHQIQYRMAGFSSVFFNNWWVLEGQATAMEEVGCAACDEYIHPVNEFYKTITASLPYHHYSAAPFWLFLMQKYSNNHPAIIGEFLLQYAKMDLYAALRWVLAGKAATIDSAIHDFALWNLFSGRRYRTPGYYREADRWPTLTTYSGEHTLGPKSAPQEGTANVLPLSARYVRIVPDPSLTDARKLRITIRSSSTDPGEIRAWIVPGRNPDGRGDPIKVLNTGKAQEVVEDFSFTSTMEVFLVLTHGRIDTPARDVQYTVELIQPQDIAFSMDTTGSMGGSIFALRSTATRIMNDLIENEADFRIAITEFKDFPYFPYGWGGDYPYRADSPFSNDPAVITGGINMLYATGGGDWPESQLSGIMGAINAQDTGPWRSGVKKSVIVMTDAPPHDPEPYTGLTNASVAAAARNGGVTTETRPAARIGALTESLPETPITIYGVVVGGDFMAYNSLNALATATGGKVWLTSYYPTDIAAALLEALGEVTGGGEEPPPGGNRPPDVSGAMADPSRFWPPNGKMVSAAVTNVSDPDGDTVTISITGISQDEPVGREPDGAGIGTAVAGIRAARDGNGNGRVYTIAFTAMDGRGGSSNGTVTVCIPHDQGGNTVCTDDGALYDSTMR